jgi:hypothetical protein
MEIREARMKKTYYNYIEVVGVKKVMTTQNESAIAKGLNTAKIFTESICC